MGYICLLGIDPEKTQKCKPSECASCGWECPLDNPNETVERCEDCAFAKETD